MTPQSIQAILKKYDIRPKKGLGQHFLSAVPTIRKIVNAIDPSEDECVLEIGPGPGLMTSMIAERAGFVIAVDKDPSILEVAKCELSNASNIKIVEGDILESDLKSLLLDIPKSFVGKPLRVTGNLPYNVSSPILFWILQNRKLISRATLMLQKEVAMRIVAKPGGKDYGILSVQLQAFAQTKKLFDVAPSNFIPPPAVMSSVIEMDFSSGGNTKIDDEDIFRETVRAAFGQRRKTLRNSLLGSKLDISRDALDRALEGLEIDGSRRPETLSVSEFAKLAAAIKTLRG